MASLKNNGIFFNIKEYFTKHENIFALLVFSLLICIYFSSVVFHGKTLTTSALTGGVMSSGAYEYNGAHPPFFPISDPGAFAWQDEPLSHYIDNILKKEHRLPLWNPNVGIGYPILSGLQIGMFFPPNWISFLGSSELAWDVLMLLKILGAGFFSYLFARKISLSKQSALATGIIFMFSGYTMGFLNMAHFSTDCMVPLILFSFESFLQNLTTKNFLFTIAVIALSFLPGMPESTIFALTLGSFWFLFSVFFLHSEIIKKIKVIGFFALANILAAALCAIQIIPALELILNSFTSHIGTNIGLNHQPLYSITSILYPFLFYPLFYKWILAYYYVGISTIVLSFIAPASIKEFSQKNQAIIIFFTVFAILSFAKIFGIPLINWIGTLPILNFLVFYKYLAPEAIFSLALLAGYGLQLISTKQIKYLKTKLAILFAIIIALSIYSLKSTLINLAPQINDLDVMLKYLLANSEKIIHFNALHNLLNTLKTLDFSPTLIQMLFSIGNGIFIFLLFTLIIIKANKNKHRLGNIIILFIVTELFLYSLPLLRASRYDTYKKAPYIEFLQQDKTSIFRTYGQSSPDQYSPLYPNTSSAFAIQDIRFLMPLAVKRYFSFLQHVVGVSPEEINEVRFTGMHPLKLSNRFLDLLNVKYFLTMPQNATDQTPSKIKIKYLSALINPPVANNKTDIIGKNNLVYSKEIRITKNINVIPRAFIVHRTEVIQDRNKIFTALKNPNFNLREKIIIEANAPNTNSLPLVDKSSTTITNYHDEKVELVANMQNDGFLVLLDQYYPGWKAYVDNQETFIYPTDYTFRSIFLKKGNHKIQFIYDPLSYKIGKLISIITLLLLVGFIIGRKKFDQCLRNIKN